LVTNYLKYEHSSPSPKLALPKLRGVLVPTSIEPEFIPTALTLSSFLLLSFRVPSNLKR